MCAFELRLMFLNVFEFPAIAFPPDGNKYGGCKDKVT